MRKGYIKYYRSSIDNPLYKKPLVWHFWDYCLLKARKYPKEIDFNGKPFLLERGCFIMSLSTASEKTGLSEQNIKTAIKNLENHKMIEKSTKILTKQATLIKVLKFDHYQVEEDESNEETNQALTKYQPSANEVLTIIKKEEESKKKVKKDPTHKKYTQEFDRLWIDYPNSGDAKQRTFKNYKKTKLDFNMTDDQMYTACMNYAKREKEKGTDPKYMYKLSNLVGREYKDSLEEYLNMDLSDSITADIDPLEIARGYK